MPKNIFTMEEFIYTVFSFICVRLNRSVWYSYDEIIYSLVVHKQHTNNALQWHCCDSSTRACVAIQVAVWDASTVTQGRNPNPNRSKRIALVTSHAYRHPSWMHFGEKKQTNKQRLPPHPQHTPINAIKEEEHVACSEFNPFQCHITDTFNEHWLPLLDASTVAVNA